MKKRIHVKKEIDAALPILKFNRLAEQTQQWQMQKG